MIDPIEVEVSVLFDRGRVEFDPATTGTDAADEVEAAAAAAALLVVTSDVAAGAEEDVVDDMVDDDAAAEEAPAMIENWFDCARIWSLFVGTIKLIW